MTTLLKVAVLIDRADAIRTGRNRWGWVPTEIDLDTLQQPMRDALALCPEEEDGALLLTHVKRPPGSHRGSPGDSAASHFMLNSVHRVPERFAREREGAPRPVEATPETALEALRHLAAMPERALAKAEARKAELLAQAAEQREAYLRHAHEAVAVLDAWLATPAADLVAEDTGKQRPEHRFDAVRPPEKPSRLPGG
jgi:hypothetical protein